MEKTVIEVPGISEGIRKAGVPLSAAIKANGFVFVSGMAPMDPATGGFVKGDIATQTKASLEAMKRALDAAGSSLEKVCKVTIYAVNAAHYRTINEVYARFFPSAPPARTFVTVGSWPMDFDIEIDCVALA
jgi:2-iminobutanoate/2-iminopropanoate deaminase